MRPFLPFLLLAFMTSCVTPPPQNQPEKLATLKIVPASFSDLPGWSNDDHLAALRTYSLSCARILNTDPTKELTGKAWSGNLGNWQKACAALPNPAQATLAQAKSYFETWFIPVAATAEGNPQGLFTGYYEASLRGSRFKTSEFQIPLRARPEDLVMVNLGEFRDELKGQRLAGRVIKGYLKPYEDRAAIEDGKLPMAQDKPLLWTDDVIGAFFLQIQGSGAVTLPNGETVRIGYDGQNGHPYYAIGKELVKRGHLQQDEVSMQTIRAWLLANPDEGKEIMRTNKSYVFFRIIEKDGAIGGEGLPLTAGRSLAIDHSLIPYGLPIYVDIAEPEGGAPIQRLMVAQDTGGAIKGPVRGDVFWGLGPAAEHKAGLMKSLGRYWFLLPKS